MLEYDSSLSETAPKLPGRRGSLRDPLGRRLCENSWGRELGSGARAGELHIFIAFYSEDSSLHLHVRQG